MRYWLLIFVAASLFLTEASSQDVKPKGKEPDQKSKEIPEVTEIAGKSFELWKKDITHPDPSRREVAMKTILNFGPEKASLVVPDIIKQLEKHSPPQHRVDLSVRVNGTLVLSTVFQYYLQSHKDTDPKLLKQSFAIFKTSLKDPQAILKIRTLQALRYLGPTAREVLPEVIAAVGDGTTWETRKEAIETLNVLVSYDLKAPPPVKSMEALDLALDDLSAIVRYTALQAIPYVGNNLPAGKLQTEMLAKMSKLTKEDIDNTVRIQAHLSLILYPKYITPLTTAAQKNHLDPILKFTKHTDPTTRIHAIQAVGFLGKAGVAGSQAVMDALDDTDPNVAVEAMQTLLFMREYKAIPRLRRMAEDKTVNEVLRRFTEQTAQTLEAVQEHEKKLKNDKKIDKK